MINGKKITVVMPAYNAEKTLRQTYLGLDLTIVDDVILVDDESKDHTSRVSQELGIHTIRHFENLGYGGNQKSCYRAAIDRGADIVVMLHPDYQYNPKLVPSMAYMIATGVYDCILASRIIDGTALKGGMPLYKYISNRILTFVQNLLMGQKLSEYHTGYRAFSREILETLPLGECSDDFIFDNQMLAMICARVNYRIGEISCPTLYFPDASSINFPRSVKYGIGVLAVSFKFFLQRLGLFKKGPIDGGGQTVLDIPNRGEHLVS